MAKRFLEHIGKYFIMLKAGFTRPENSKVYWKELMLQCDNIGIRSVPIVIIVSFFLGMVLTIQTAYQLVNPLVPKTTIANVVRDTFILEISPSVICIVLAGVVGSRISSELGNMRVSEQIDALEVMGINTKAYLVLPKVLAALITIPCLVTISILAGIWGGYVSVIFSHIISQQVYYNGLVRHFREYILFVSMVKAITFAFILSSISAYYGYNVSGGAVEIGKASITAVIVSCILILATDYAIAFLML